MAIKPIEFSEEEFKFLERNITALYKVRCENATKAERIKHEYTTANSLYNKVSRAKERGDHKAVFNRRELRALQAITTESIDLINTRTIPGYMHRIDTQPDKKAFYKAYLNRAIEVRDVLIASILKKVEAAL